MECSRSGLNRRSQASNSAGVSLQNLEAQAHRHEKRNRRIVQRLIGGRGGAILQLTDCFQRLSMRCVIRKYTLATRRMDKQPSPACRLWAVWLAHNPAATRTCKPFKNNYSPRMAKKSAANPTDVGSVHRSDPASQRDVHTTELKASSLLSTCVIRRGDNLEMLRGTHACP
jgi:hypothetical protein